MQRFAGLMLAMLALSACGEKAADAVQDPQSKPRLGLMSSLPILWSGNDAFSSLSGRAEAAPHWAMGALGKGYRVDPLDALTPEALAQVDVLLLAQPRILTPAENVALDDWVRAGGQALVLADPKLVGDYDYPLGDPRRPMDSAMLSPILSRWGLELVHDPAAERVRTVPLDEAEMVVADAGGFRLEIVEGSSCKLALGDLAAQCAVGKGRVALLADATLLEDPVGGAGSPAALNALLGMARESAPESTRENAGQRR